MSFFIDKITVKYFFKNNYTSIRNNLEEDYTLIKKYNPNAIYSIIRAILELQFSNKKYNYDFSLNQSLRDFKIFNLYLVFYVT